MTATPAQRVGLHELTLLLDGDVTCQAHEGRPATHVRVHAACEFFMCVECTEKTRAFLAPADRRVGCETCGARGIPAANFTIRPI